MNKRRGARIFFALLLVVTASMTPPIPAKASPARDANLAGGTPSELECQAMTTPLGLGNAHPRLSWRLNDPRRGAVQSACEIRVASSPEKLQRDEADVWDSGKIMSADSVSVPYGGPALVSRGRYFWEVRVWDGEGKPTAYSKPSWWEMGLLSAEDWTARWIAQDMPVERGDHASNPKWIWSTDKAPSSVLQIHFGLDAWSPRSTGMSCAIQRAVQSSAESNPISHQLGLLYAVGFPCPSQTRTSQKYLTRETRAGPP